MTDTVEPTPIGSAPDVPNSGSKELTFDAMYEEFNAWQKNTLVPGMNGLASDTHQNAVAANESKQSTTLSAAAAHQDAIDAMAYRNTAGSHASTAGTKAGEASSSAEAAALDRARTETAADNAARDAQAVAEALDAIEDGPVASFNGRGGSVTLNKEDVAAAMPDAVRAKSFIDATVTNTAATGTVTLDMSSAGVFDLTLTGSATLAISNVPALSGETLFKLIRITQGASAKTLTWWSGITALDAATNAKDPPAANKTLEFIVSTTDGANWILRKGKGN